MNTGISPLAFAYLRLSNEEAREGESSSITNQRLIVQNYCAQNGITLVREFVDDGWSGGDFNRPGFIEMLSQLREGRGHMVITKDLSRLGRDMREASYYAEQFFPEHGIRYIAIADNFDTRRDNVMAPFLFAMNEVYLRDGSRKVRDVLRSKRESGQYCACPPYGYRKDPENRHRLTPDEATAPVVERIFLRAAAGDSSRKIAMDLSADGVIPPLKYRALYRDEFSEEGASHASDIWNYTTVKRILKNQVYLGHTLLGRSRKASVKSRKKVPVPQEEWAVTRKTHPAIVDEALFRRAQENLGRGTVDAGGQTRRSIFGGIAFCGRCGHALCSCGTVYKGEREKYWYLSCTHQRRDIPGRCEGVRIRYADLTELIRRDLNSLLSLSDAQICELVQRAVERSGAGDTLAARTQRRELAQARLATIDKIVSKLYTDNALGRLDDQRLCRMVSELERESSGLEAQLRELSTPPPETAEDNYVRFFELARRYTHIETLDRETLSTFVERVEVGPKIYASGKSSPRGHEPYRQSVRIFYRFIGELKPDPPAEV